MRPTTLMEILYEWHFMTVCRAILVLRLGNAYFVLAVVAGNTLYINGGLINYLVDDVQTLVYGV